MVEGTTKRREYYLARIREAEEISAHSSNLDTIRDMEVLIQSYRRLLGRLPPVTDSEH